MVLLDNIKGVIIMFVVMVGFGFNDMLVKMVMKMLVMGEIILICGMILIFFIFLLVLYMGVL